MHDSDTMLMVPSTVVRREDGTAVGWVYLGVDGSVSTLHVEASNPKTELAGKTAIWRD